MHTVLLEWCFWLLCNEEWPWHINHSLISVNDNILSSRFHSLFKLARQPYIFLWLHSSTQLKPWLCTFSVLLQYLRALSSHSTFNTCFIWWHATCDPLWPKHSSFDSSFFYAVATIQLQSGVLEFSLDVSSIISHLQPFTKQMQGVNWVFF